MLPIPPGGLRAIRYADVHVVEPVAFATLTALAASADAEKDRPLARSSDGLTDARITPGGVACLVGA